MYKMLTLEELMNINNLIDKINNDNLLVTDSVQYAERFILVKRCLAKIYNLYTNFNKNVNNKDTDNYDSFIAFLDSKKNNDAYSILVNEIMNNIINRRYYDNTIMYGKNNLNMENGEYEFKQIICQALSKVYDVDKSILYELMNVNEQNELC